MKTQPKIRQAMAGIVTRLGDRIRARLADPVRPLSAPSMRSKRWLVLAAAFAVPAFAAPGGDWANPFAAQVIRIDLADVPARMPFERAGSGFPGSAFYYLEESDEAQVAIGLPAVDPAKSESASKQLGLALDSGPAALAFRSGGTGLDKARALTCMAQAIYYEAASESEAGQRAVAQVVLNRVAHTAWPNSVCGVVFEGSTRNTGCQFSFTCDGSMVRRPSTAGWQRAQQVAMRALSGEVYAPVGLATHYHTQWVNPYWAASLDHVGTIGAHRFYRWHGANGLPGAFRAAYAGIERTYQPNLHPRRDRPGADLAGATGYRPITHDIAASYITPALPAADVTGRARAASPSPSAIDAAVQPAFTGSGQVRAEYANAGQWIDRAGAQAGSTKP